MKIVNLLIVMLLAGSTLAQPVELKDISGSGFGKFKKSPKKIYIAQFRVNFQLLYSQTETAEGGRVMGGGYRSEAKAGLTMAVKGVSAADLQEITDKLYQDYVAKIKSEGFEVLSAEEASTSKQFVDWERKTGGTLNEAQYPGYITAIPTGFEYFVKRTKEGGKEKTSFVDNSLKVSNDVKATVVKVSIVVPFVEDAESAGSKILGDAVKGIAKVVLRPNLRIEKDIVGTAGGFSSDVAVSKISYGFQEGMGTIAMTNLHLKNDIEIPGIFEDKKYKAVETASTDLWGTDYGALTIFQVNDKFLSKAQPLPCDAAKYKEGVLNAAGSYLSATLAEFLSNIK